MHIFMMRSSLQTVVSGVAGVAFAVFVAHPEGDNYPDKLWLSMLLISISMWLLQSMDIWVRGKYWDLLGIPFSALVSTFFGIALSFGGESFPVLTVAIVTSVVMLGIALLCPMDRQMAREWAEAKSRRAKKKQHPSE